MPSTSVSWAFRTSGSAVRTLRSCWMWRFTKLFLIEYSTSLVPAYVTALKIILLNNNFSYILLYSIIIYTINYYCYKPGCRNYQNCMKLSKEVLKRWIPHSQSQSSRYLDDRLSPMKTSLSALTGKSWGPEASEPAGEDERSEREFLEFQNY